MMTKETSSPTKYRLKLMDTGQAGMGNQQGNRQGDRETKKGTDRATGESTGRRGTDSDKGGLPKWEKINKKSSTTMQERHLCWLPYVFPWPCSVPHFFIQESPL